MASEINETETREKSLNFLEEIIEESIAKGEKRVQTRFPPEPNGYLHIGHAKSICINFGLARKYGGRCNLRFDDTNPVKEDVEYVDSIKRDIQWLGFQWAEEHYASDYFDQLYEWALELIRKGLAYVDDQTQEQIRENRGTVSVPGTPSPWRDRSVEENLDLFVRMKNGEFPDGSKVLRAKIDMAHPNMLFRDPIMYRIIHAEHHRTGNKWCIYPMYDYAHGQSDSIERITHSICTLEFDVHRPLYDWFIQALGIYPSHQYEFARLNLTYTLMSKRRLLKLVQEGAVMGWDDPRMPTICALRRKGYTPASVRNFAEMVGVAKRDNVIDLGKLEYCVREDLNKVAERRMAVLNPLRRLHGESPEEVLPPAAGRRGAPALLLPDQVRGGGEGCRGQYHRTALHLRPDVRQRFVERRTPREGCYPLGVGTGCAGGRGTPLQSALYEGEPRRRGGGSDLGGQPQPRIDGQGQGLSGAVAA